MAKAYGVFERPWPRLRPVAGPFGPGPRRPGAPVGRGVSGACCTARGILVSVSREQGLAAGRAPGPGGVFDHLPRGGGGHGHLRAAGRQRPCWILGPRLVLALGLTAWLARQGAASGPWPDKGVIAWRHHSHDFVEEYKGLVGFGMDRPSDEATVWVYLQKFSRTTPACQAILPRLEQGELEVIFDTDQRPFAASIMSEEEYHDKFLKDPEPHHHQPRPPHRGVGSMDPPGEALRRAGPGAGHPGRRPFSARSGPWTGRPSALTRRGCWVWRRRRSSTSRCGPPWPPRPCYPSESRGARPPGLAVGPARARAGVGPRPGQSMRHGPALVVPPGALLPGPGARGGPIDPEEYELVEDYMAASPGPGRPQMRVGLRPGAEHA